MTPPSTYVLSILNPSDHPRSGWVDTAWQPIQKATKIDPDKLVVLGPGGNPLRAQVDKVDPKDPERARLVFLLDRTVDAGREDYSHESGTVTLSETATPTQFEHPAKAQVQPGVGFRLENSRLNVWFNLGNHDGMPWFAGAASSVLLDGQEVLDAFADDFMGHDLEKRCMQVDRICLSRPAWEWTACQEERLYARPYEVVSSNSGPVRATVTIASTPFDYTFWDPQREKACRYEARLYRVLSLYVDATYIIEDLYLRAVPRDSDTGTRPIHLSFTARYFCYMEMGFEPRITHYAHIPDWLAIGSQWDPYQGYGFATDVHAEGVVNPVPDVPFPDEYRQARTYSWELGVGTGARCLHLFRFGSPDSLAEETGRAWYYHVYQPLGARLHPQGARDV
jgi:hypothetical protein